MQGVRTSTPWRRASCTSEWGVEAHRLRSQQAGAERRRMVQLEPGRGVHEVGEAHRVALGEAEVREGGELGVDLVGDGAGDAPLGHPLVEPGPQALHALGRPLGAHGLAELVGLAGREAGDVDGHLHQLLLEQRDAQGLLQRRLQQGMQVGDGLLAVAPADVGVDRPALDRTGPDEGDLDHQVVEGPGLQPRQGGHLGAGLHLEHADGVGSAQHVVDGVVLGDGGQIDGRVGVLPHEVDHLVQRGEHPEAEQVELHESHRRAVVLVPLEDAAVGHAPTPPGKPR